MSDSLFSTCRSGKVAEKLSGFDRDSLPCSAHADAKGIMQLIRQVWGCGLLMMSCDSHM